MFSCKAMRAWTAPRAASSAMAFPAGARAVSSLNEMPLKRYELPQWSPSPRQRRNRPRELAMWDKLQEYPVAKPSTTMTNFVNQNSEELPHKDMYASIKTPQKHSWSFPFLAYLSRAVGGGLIDLGFKKGDKFLTWAGNGPEQLLLLLGGPQAGATQVAVSPDASVHAIQQVLKDEHIRSVFFDQRWGQEYRLDSIKQIFPLVDEECQTNWIVSKKYRALKHFINVTGEDYLPGTMTWRSFPAYDPDPHPVDQVRKFLHADDTVLIPYKLGSNRDELKKCDPLSTNALFESGKKANEAISLTSDDRVLSLAPMWEKFGITAGVFGPLQQNAKIVHGNRRFKANEVLDVIDKQRPTTIIATSSQLQEIANTASQDENAKFVLKSVQKGLIDVGSAGSPLPKHPFKGATFVPVDSEAMDKADVPFRAA